MELEIPQKLESHISHARRARYVLYFVVFIALRLQLLRDFPVLLTDDSWDFLGSASSIARHASFSSQGIGLRDCRTPGYPLFQAAFLPLTRMRSDRISLLQACVGLAIPLIGLAIGRTLRSPRAGEGLALFLGLNPIYFIYEHSIMSETLSLSSLLAFTWMALLALRDGLSPRKGIILGVLFGFNALVRINSLPFCATLLAGVCISHLRRATPRRWAVVVSFSLAWGLSSLLVVCPWIYRNYCCHRKISLNPCQNRALLVYKSMHGSFDGQLPRFRREQQSLNCSVLDYNWFWRLRNQYGVLGAERVASELLDEQWRAHPWRHFRDSFWALISFGGYHDGGEDDLAPVRYWFEHLVGDVPSLDRLHTGSRSIATGLGFTYVPARGDSAWTRAWQRAGSKYLAVLRPILFASFFGSLVLRRIGRRRTRTSETTSWAIFCLSAAYLATASFHAFTLTDSDRFSTLYDWAAFLVILI